MADNGRNGGPATGVARVIPPRGNGEHGVRIRSGGTSLERAGVGWPLSSHASPPLGFVRV